MNILILGSGGREHAFALKISQSSLCSRLFVAPGNGGTSQIAENINIVPTNFQSVKKIVLEKNITMVIVGPEDPLVHGIYDFFQEDTDLSHVQVVGPSQKGATLEGSKEFAKEFMKRHQIPTAKYESFTAETLQKGYEFLETLSPPYVLKADGLAAGKGVLIVQQLEEAKAELKNMLMNQKFGAAGKKVVIEQFLSGIELSCFVLTDGTNYKILPTAKDYKRIGEADTGLNTGGMGAVSPVPFADASLMQKIENRIVKPTILGLQKEKIIYQGFIFIGLIKVNDDPYVIEYNVRMGDPETEVVLPRIKSDLIPIFKSLKDNTLHQTNLEVIPESATTVMMVSGGYPEDYEKGKIISGIENVKDSIVFHAGTTLKNNNLETSGGRVLAVTSFGQNFKEALQKSYESIAKIHFDKMYFRKDIGFDL
ncbi:Phosphoribosylamine--glycine ligase [Capnocytophaga canimorsus]|uniref:Phosphoribosylamine--glycine ligase n=1 Tax=Capnocytophaga canimorsus TaxID=28188 RepID=A0A0B7HMS9_9FLAO|nr:phosphoribosylamine--glycine ligase [Capnocytophaga canimorsus]ATA77488.1 phosphoribosylamine--glycine ligase [Capnocytophaga canimorsus]PJI82464.1 phosphoribosylamine--glycine ligase [Capnocytophaga canimorsus]CEN38798.1 Phosphoribosylamine--glycine ligase [Capnocytophaga canimorsus]STA72755.1 Phosphoribosylamine--glycine ligase [Capnocytophaga canimorsus]